MFLSDELIQSGKQGNPRSNMSQGEQAKEMQTIINDAKAKGVPNIKSSVKYAVNYLRKEGFLYYERHNFKV